MKRRIACMIMAMVLAISLLPLGAVPAKAASNLMYSENVVALIKQFEGFSASAYWDVSQWTIGYGTVGAQGQTMTEAQADLALRDRLNIINTKINEFTARNNLYLSQYQHDALISFSFNCGTDWTTQGGRFFEAVTSNSDVNAFLFAISLWANVGSTPDATLLNRRLAEANLYLNGVYSKSAPAQYTYVILDPNGGVAGENGEDKMQAYLSGSNVSILAANPSRSGATFGGWFTSPTGGSGVKYLSASTAGRTLYAQYGTPVSVTSGYCYIRNGAGSNYTQIGTVASGAQLVIVETAQVNGVLWGRCIDGWVELSNTNYIAGTTTVGGTTTGTTTTTTGTVISTGTVVCKTGVHVRSGAGIGYSIIASYRKGDQVRVYAQSTASGMVWGQTDKGWVSMNYIQLNTVVNSGTNTGTTTGTVIATGTVKANTGLNVRNGAGVNYTLVGRLTGGTPVNIYERVTVNGAQWGRIGTNQWVCMTYIRLNSTGSSTVTIPSTGYQGKVTTGLRIRAGAGTNNATVGFLPAGSTVVIYEMTSVNGVYWGRIANGWVCMSYVQMTTGTTGTTGSVTWH